MTSYIYPFKILSVFIDINNISGDIQKENLSSAA